MARIERRAFLRFVGKTLIAGGILGLLKSWGLSVPDAEEEQQVKEFTPGWLETRNPNRPAFIQPEMGGHKGYLRYMTMNDPLLKNILHTAFTDAVRSGSVRPSLSGAFKKHLQYAAKELANTGATLDDVAHIAFFTFAAVNSNYFTYQEIHDSFGVDVDMSGHSGNQSFLVANFPDNVPTVFSSGASEPLDADKPIHFANFAFLTHEYWYAKKYGLQ